MGLDATHPDVDLLVPDLTPVDTDSPPSFRTCLDSPDFGILARNMH